MFPSISRGVLRRHRREARLEIDERLAAQQRPAQAHSMGTLQRSDIPPPHYRSQPNGYQSSGSTGQPETHHPTAKGQPVTDTRLHPSGRPSQSPKILSVGGGKGGIGKSFISANTAICLAKQGYSVSLVDLDLGAANLHTCLGVPNPKVGIFDFVSERVSNFEDIGVPTQVPGLTLYGGGQEFWQQVRPHSGQKVKLISKLQQLRSDYVILDLGAGTHVNTLDFFIFSHAGLLVIVPEPTSIENAYVFLKSVLYRKLQSIAKALREEEACKDLFGSLCDPRVTTPPFANIEAFAAQNPRVGGRILQLIRLTHLGIVMNQVRTKGDVDIGHSMASICGRYFGFSAQFLGVTHYDDEAWKSVRNRKPICSARPNSSSAQDIEGLSRTIATEFLPVSSQHTQPETG
jgi:flagellar biosynthesis protein FlhG